MRSVWLKYVLAVIPVLMAVFAVLLIPRTARAAAPLCDFRGASVVVHVADEAASVYVEPTPVVPVSNVAALCDPRGATMIAPAPQLQSESTWLMLTPGSDALTTLLTHSVIPGQAPLAFEMQLPDPSVICAVPCVAPAGEMARVACPPAENRAHDGVKSDLERPPRG